jgi:hypothetical protein
MKNEQMESWAVPMAELIHSVDPKIQTGLGGMASQDGCYIKDSTGEKIAEVFSAAGYTVISAQLHYSITVCSKEGPDKGFYIEPTEDEEETGLNVVIFWFDEA